MLTWYCARTAPRQEERVRKSLADDLGLTAYLPLERVTVIRRGKQVTEDRPLLSRHLFVGVQPDEPPWRAIAETDGLERLLSAERYGAPSVVPWRAIAMIQTVEGELNDDFERRAAKAHKYRRRGRPDALIAKLKAAAADQRAEIILEFMERREGSVTLKLGDLKAA